MRVTLADIDLYMMAKEQNLWAMKSYTALNPGDEVYLVMGIHSLNRPIPRGFPHLKTYTGMGVQVEEFWHIRVTSDVVSNPNSPVSDTHPYTFSFELIQSSHDFPLEDLGEEMMESVRKLYNSKLPVHRRTPSLLV